VAIAGVDGRSVIRRRDGLTVRRLLDDSRREREIEASRAQRV